MIYLVNPVRFIQFNTHQYRNFHNNIFDIYLNHWIPLTTWIIIWHFMSIMEIKSFTIYILGIWVFHIFFILYKLDFNFFIFDIVSDIKSPMSTFLMRFPDPLLHRQMSPTLSTFIVMWYLTSYPRNSRIFITNITSFHTSEAATSSSLLVDRVTKPCCLEPQLMRQSLSMIIHPEILFLLYLPPPQSLSEKNSSDHDSLVFDLGFSIKPISFMYFVNLIGLNNCLKLFWIALDMVFLSSQNEFYKYGLENLVR